MYYPYFRGKQFELITIREMADLFAKKGFVPVIEPVREAFSGLEKALNAVCASNGRAIVIVNPSYGDHQGGSGKITSFLQGSFDKKDNIQAGILLRSDMKIDDVMALYNQHRNHRPVLIHAGFTDPKALADRLKSEMEGLTNIFIDNNDDILYRKHFQDSKRILIRDGFRRLRNADYTLKEQFSDLHVTYKERGMQGFGDFLMVGDAYSESGGPAYAVAIHLTFIDPEQDDVMYIYHFVSDERDTPADPGGKFSQALKKLIAEANKADSHIFPTTAVGGFRTLHFQNRFPGLGYVKKLSMKHHIETISRFLG